MVAKIYDPLYYLDFDDYGLQQHVVWDAELEYRRETQAYGVIQKSQAAKRVTPNYHGSWTLEIDTQIQHEGGLFSYVRQVPLILLSWIHGQVMSDIDPADLMPSLRYDIVKKAIAAERILFGQGIDHRDLYSRNIIITEVPYDSSTNTTGRIDIKILDFGASVLYSRPSSEQLPFRKEQRFWYPKFHSPIVRYQSGDMSGLVSDGWFPWEYGDNDGKATQWLWEQFKDDERFIPVVWDPVKPDVKAVHKPLPVVTVPTEQEDDKGDIHHQSESD
ncbi:hypothetical protein NX059_012023 [Plenodomus lindquistii]|nr:hypothetical protein NX059_012023 [Plenodomus lindquistii]